ncbi:unnamed protein product [Phytophthora fragariaefolia]|uniref:Unnamed protein product n=1 Tax=Phytophthora fragariaefolia TaxID=1490495 RepID=A0A9W6Y948_9STRA|nr:unnamed protein product [Phytophthora fragariaefolia]
MDPTKYSSSTSEIVFNGGPSGFVNFSIKHIAGEDNIWVDIISRWHTRGVVRAAAVQTHSHHVAPLAKISPLRPMSDTHYVFPTLNDIRVTQHAAGQETSRLRITLRKVDGIVTVEAQDWIPNRARELLVRDFVVAHTGVEARIQRLHRCKVTYGPPVSLRKYMRLSTDVCFARTSKNHASSLGHTDQATWRRWTKRRCTGTSTHLVVEMGIRTTYWSPKTS